MARWRKVKQGKIDKSNNQTKQNKNKQDRYICASPLHRVKAFITDMFMIMMPIMYFTTYIVMGDKDTFQASQTARWATMIIYGLIVVIFWVRSGQTPGFKAYSLKIIDDNTKQTLSYGLAIARYMMFLLSAVFVVGLIFPFFREDKKTLQDILMQTSVIQIEDNTKR